MKGLSQLHNCSSSKRSRPLQMGELSMQLAATAANLSDCCEKFSDVRKVEKCRGVSF